MVAIDGHWHKSLQKNKLKNWNRLIRFWCRLFFLLVGNMEVVERLAPG